jgi:MHS family shikimate/dehydroshikimate transporter-like MFS transporter
MPQSMIKAASAGSIGALLEWYDFYIFATASAIVFGRLFFPGDDAFTGTMASFGAFAAGFFARPFGGVIFGHIGDTMGRRTSLILTVLIIGVGTLLIGLLPTYAEIGYWAPALLVALRVAQGIGLGGEYAGASLIAIEHAPGRERGFWGSLPQAASPGGLLLAAGMFSAVSLLPQDAFLAWGWRVPFLAGLPLLLVGVFLRLRVTETPDFERARHDSARDHGVEESPGARLVRTHLRHVVLATGARLVETVSGNMIKSFGLTYVTLQLKLPKETALTALTVTAALGLLLTPVYGSLGDRLGQQRVYLIGAAFVALLAFPFFALLGLRTAPAIWLAFIVAYNIGPTLLLSVQPALFSRMFAAPVRFTGMSIAYQGSSIVGGLTPLFSLWLLRQSHGAPWPVACFLVAIAFLSFACVTAAIVAAPSRRVLSP